MEIQGSDVFKKLYKEDAIRDSMCLDIVGKKTVLWFGFWVMGRMMTPLENTEIKEDLILWGG